MPTPDAPTAAEIKARSRAARAKVEAAQAALEQAQHELRQVERQWIAFMHSTRQPAA